MIFDTIGVKMSGQMCAQIDVLKKIRKKGKVNGYDVDLAEAQAKDYMENLKKQESEYKGSKVVEETDL